MYPEDYRYSKTHEWVSAKGELAKIGITDHAQMQLGDVVHIELPAAGTAVAAGEMFGSIDSVKAVSDLMSPVSGTVVEVNEDLDDSPELVNEDPHTAGWMVIVKMDELSELDELMDVTQYEEFIEREP